MVKGKTGAYQKKQKVPEAVKRLSAPNGKSNDRPKNTKPKKKSISKKSLAVGAVLIVETSNEVIDFLEKLCDGAIALAASEPVKSAIDNLSAWLQSSQFFATSSPLTGCSDYKRASAQLDEVIDLSRRQKAVLETVEILVRLLPMVYAPLKNAKSDEVGRVNGLVALAIQRGVEGGVKSMTQIVESGLERIIFDLAVDASKGRGIKRGI